MPDTSAEYIHGHHESVLRSHRWRSAANSAAYLLPSIEPGMAILDVGCGPGTISLDLARSVAPGGRVVGLDAVEEPLLAARADARSQGIGNVVFEVGDVYDLHYWDGTFDIVHAACRHPRPTDRPSRTTCGVVTAATAEPRRAGAAAGASGSERPGVASPPLTRSPDTCLLATRQRAASTLTRGGLGPRGRA